MGMSMKSKRKTTLYSGQGWTNNYRNTQSLSDACHSNLISIAKATHDANKEYQSVVEIYLRDRARKRFSSSQPRFTQDDLDTMKALVKGGPPTDTTSTSELLESLKDVTYTDIWDRAADNMAFLKGLRKHQTSQKHQDNGRKRAINLRSCRITIETGFNQVRKEVQDSNLDLDLVCVGIQEKIEMLQKYEKAYPISVDSHPATPIKSQTSILILVVLTLIIISVILISVAWIKSTSEQGSVEDSDFWMLIPNTMYQILGLLTSVYTIHRRAPDDSTAWKCALWFMGGGILCGIVSVHCTFSYPPYGARLCLSVHP
ncbi:hypothetical protein F4820DRAFT_92589 [Hypoxylon rubiginosum]|uniref:Uncharacterized protein n=1 Tax=Hypoxylon rubiginosum TaxID=110542 RepID=A0ACB9YN66_9PEZI|nr:hypothetical protein F4820DRAFT_92589 [Hypoxylon rubiginosum]